MEIKHCIVRTDCQNFEPEQMKRYLIIIELPLPGGRAIYEIPSTLDLNSNIEKAYQLVSPSNRK